jgi:hypothetical protein
MKQCLGCAYRLFFKPLSDETFTCCFVWEETVEDINLSTGVSPAIQRYGVKGFPCGNFEPGKSICETPASAPFTLHPIRVAGEKNLLNKLSRPHV